MEVVDEHTRTGLVVGDKGRRRGEGDQRRVVDLAEGEDRPSVAVPLKGDYLGEIHLDRPIDSVVAATCHSGCHKGKHQTGQTPVYKSLQR